jgi:hypothetical protein
MELAVIRSGPFSPDTPDALSTQPNLAKSTTSAFPHMKVFGRIIVSYIEFARRIRDLITGAQDDIGGLQHS